MLSVKHAMETSFPNFKLDKFIIKKREVLLTLWCYKVKGLTLKCQIILADIPAQHREETRLTSQYNDHFNYTTKSSTMLPILYRPCPFDTTQDHHEFKLPKIASDTKDILLHIQHDIQN